MLASLLALCCRGCGCGVCHVGSLLHDNVLIAHWLLLATCFDLADLLALAHNMVCIAPGGLDGESLAGKRAASAVTIARALFSRQLMCHGTVG